MAQFAAVLTFPARSAPRSRNCDAESVTPGRIRALLPALFGKDACKLMWLPTPIYERTPQLWLLMGVLFVVLGLYIGLAYELTIFYLVLGVICVGRGLQVWRLRSIYRRARNQEGALSEDPAVEAAGN